MVKKKDRLKKPQSQPMAGFGVYKYKKKWNLIQNSHTVKKVSGPQKGYGEKRCEIQGGSQEMAVMAG